MPQNVFTDAAFRQQSHCEDCGDDMLETAMDFLIEAYETTGEILCDSCFEDWLEENTP